jgi:hypothetical protein
LVPPERKQRRSNEARQAAERKVVTEPRQPVDVHGPSIAPQQLHDGMLPAGSMCKVHALICKWHKGRHELAPTAE